MKREDFDIQKIIDHVQGTCTESIQSALEELYPGMDENDLDGDDHDAIDNQIFLCETCGWWCESCDQDEDGNCQDCSTIEDED